MSVITISRELGSEGDLIANVLCQRLSYRRVDKDVISQIAKEAGVDVETILAKEQSYAQRARLVSSEMQALYKTQPTAFDKKSSIDDETYAAITRKTIEDYARQGQAIIVGRGGQIVLAGWPNVIHTHLYAQLETRIQRVASRFQLSEREARKRITDSDETKKRYIAHVYSKADWKNLLYYHLALNTTLLTPETAADLITITMKAISPATGD